MQFTIKKVKQEEVGRFRRLFGKILRESFGYYPQRALREVMRDWSVDDVTRKVSSRKHLMLFAWEKKPVGFMAGRYYKNRESSCILWLGVLKEYQGRGIGRKLVKRWEQWAVKKGAKILRVNTTNPKDNLKFYESLGFKFMKVRKGKRWGMKRFILSKKL